MKTAEQRLAELDQKRALLLHKLKNEDSRKAAKVGQFVRERLPHIEQSPEFLAWLKTDIDRALFGVPGDKRKSKSGGGQAMKKEQSTLKADISNTEAKSHQVVEAPVFDYRAKFAAVGRRDEPITPTGGAGDAIRRKMSGFV
ncbi:MAG TPA: hypothetical protein VGE55_06545 [Limnobacter sp.]|uniref:hypothetical protein n=1 Tax=Limnobacter sp. TaxID=2003368 RepID=UPI002ED9F799